MTMVGTMWWLVLAVLALGCGGSSDESEGLMDTSGVQGASNPMMVSTVVDGPMAGAGASGDGASAFGEAPMAAPAPVPPGPGADALPPGERPHDARMFTIAEEMLPFEALPGVDTDRWTGVLDGAGYRIEVPRTWNGILVMYAHGYAGTGAALRVTTPSIRAHLIENGYAWAASSYRANYYDARAGVEDTNALALAFTQIAADNGRPLDEPAKRYLIGHSMGGHITGAAIEKEAAETVRTKVEYAAALPMCGVMGDVELFNYFAAYQLAAHELAGTPVAMTTDEFMAVRMQTEDALFTEYPVTTTPAGDQLKAIVQNLTGGARPIFEQAFGTKRWQDIVWGTFGGGGDVSGILAKSVVDTTMVDYQLDDDPASSDEETAFNAAVERAVADPDANGLRQDGVRWVPKVNGEISIPVLSMHTLGDLFVPFSMEQIYRERVEANGHGDLLVQWAIRGVGHCEFTNAEQVAAFDALAAWEQQGIKPEGDDVLDAVAVKSPDYGCQFTNNTFTDTEIMTDALPPLRAALPACP